MTRSRSKARPARARQPGSSKIPQPKTRTGPPEVKTQPTVEEPREAEILPEAKSPRDKPSRSKAGIFDTVNIFFAVFGAFAVAAGLLTHALLLITLLGLAYVGTLIIIAIRAKSIKWPAWRVIIALTLISGALLFIQYFPPKTVAFQIRIPNDFLGWDITHPPLYDFPVSDDPQTGHQYSNYTLEPGNIYDVSALCWTAGRLPDAPHTTVDWVSIKGGSYNGLWIPFQALALDSPVHDLPNCDSWQFKVWPF
jgi:hypothetical protein